jgi:hypothetical protein
MVVEYCPWNSRSFYTTRCFRTLDRRTNVTGHTGREAAPSTKKVLSSRSAYGPPCVTSWQDISCTKKKSYILANHDVRKRHTGTSQGSSARGCSCNSRLYFLAFFWGVLDRKRLNHPHSTSKNYKSHTILIFKAIVSATNQMTHDRMKERHYFKFEVSLWHLNRYFSSVTSLPRQPEWCIVRSERSERNGQQVAGDGVVGSSRVFQKYKAIGRAVLK